MGMDKEPLHDSKADKRKQSLYFPEDMLNEVRAQAERLDRSVSWVMQRAWKLSKEQIQALPPVNESKSSKDKE